MCHFVVIVMLFFVGYELWFVDGCIGVVFYVDFVCLYVLIVRVFEHGLVIEFVIDMVFEHVVV